MLINYFKIAIRNLFRHKTYSSINILGLTLGLTCGLLIFCVVRYHLSFDNYHDNSNRIYRIVTEIHQGEISYLPNVANPLGKVFRDEYTLAEKVGRICSFKKVSIDVEINGVLNKFQEKEVAFPEPEFFDIFDYPLVSGDIKTSLSEPHTAVLTERIARKYFGDQNPINRTFRLNNKVDFKVSGVIKDIPVNTDRRTEIFLSYNTLQDYEKWFASDDSWNGIFGDMQCFVRLKPNTKSDEVESVFPAFVMKYNPEWKDIVHFKLQPLDDVHFNSHYGGAMKKSNLLILSIIGLLIIIAGCINFINLATAQAINRSKEIGVRKVLGSSRNQLFWQFILETGIITTISITSAFVLSYISLPYLYSWFESQITLSNFLNHWLLMFTILLAIVVTFLSGSYPGLVLSRFQPASALKGKLLQHYSGFNIRRILIVTQLTISQVLIIGLIVVVYQVKFSKESDMGFEKDAIIMIPVGSHDEKMKTLKNQFSQIPGITKVSLCFTAPATTSLDTWNTDFRFDTRLENEPYSVSFKGADEDYLSTFDLKILAGRNLHPSDTAKEFLVNESFVNRLSLNSLEDIIGRKLSANGGTYQGLVVGVIRDFHDKSFHESINPILITTQSDEYSFYAVKIKASQFSNMLSSLNQTWNKVYGDKLFEYTFLDKQIEGFYRTEETMSKLIMAFSLVSIFIGCIGLYGLISFLSTRKTKEIGIRKILGGNISDVLWVFGKEFLVLIIFACFIAVPLGWFLMDSWLQSFTYRITLSAWIFIMAIGVTSFITLLTVSYQSIKAALMNPVESLRTE